MATTTRLAWIGRLTAVSACSRFRIGRHSRKSDYYGLTDTSTGREYVCRSVASAKTLARDIVAGRATHRV